MAATDAEELEKNALTCSSVMRGELTFIDAGKATKSAKATLSHASKAGKRSKTKRDHRVRESENVPRFMAALSTIEQEQLRKCTRTLMEPGKGILSADDSIRQLDARLKAVKLTGSYQTRGQYHEVLLGRGTCGLMHHLSGVLMKEEVVTQKYYHGKKITFLLKEAGIKLGIRADTGVLDLPGTYEEYTTSGLDTLDENCKRYRELGATFALWRCVYRVTWCTPSQQALFENSNTLGRFASKAQKAGLVPIVSTELLPAGDYNIELAQGALAEILASLVKALSVHHVYLEGLIIRVTAAAPGKGYNKAYTTKDVIQPTIKIFNQCLPPAVGGILLARSDNLDRSVDILNELNNCPIKKPIPMSFCYSHVIQEGMMAIWMGLEKNVEKAQDYLAKRIRKCSLASMGQHPESNGSLFISNHTKY